MCSLFKNSLTGMFLMIFEQSLLRKEVILLLYMVVLGTRYKVRCPNRFHQTMLTCSTTPSSTKLKLLTNNGRRYALSALSSEQSASRSISVHNKEKRKLDRSHCSGNSKDTLDHLRESRRPYSTDTAILIPEDVRKKLR